MGHPQKFAEPLHEEVFTLAVQGAPGPFVADTALLPVQKGYGLVEGQPLEGAVVPRHALQVPDITDRFGEPVPMALDHRPGQGLHITLDIVDQLFEAAGISASLWVY
ncbi:hypothetical protein [Streptomyces jumonjinensis]|uniref:hypothetical protein n=1 Tax=Streptomyces jumonjinensis TaxID=1945 RepID=UPI0037A0B3D4